MLKLPLMLFDIFSWHFILFLLICVQITRLFTQSGVFAFSFILGVLLSTECLQQGSVSLELWSVIVVKLVLQWILALYIYTGAPYG